MKFSIVFLPSFERDLDHYVKKGGDHQRVKHVLQLLVGGEKLPLVLKDHALQGRMKHFRELHVEHDWLLVYQRDGKNLIITCLWLVSHKKLRERERNF